MSLPCDALTLTATARELEDALRGTRVRRAVQPEPLEVRLMMRGRRDEVTWLFSAHPEDFGTHLTSYEKPNPKAAPPFVMLLRKHLEGSRLVKVDTVPGERVLTAVFQGRDRFLEPTTFSLVFEAFGPKSDVALLDPTGECLGVLRGMRLQVKEVYEPPKALLPTEPSPDPEAYAIGPLLKRELAVRLADRRADEVAAWLSRLWALHDLAPTRFLDPKAFAYPVDLEHVLGPRVHGPELLPLLDEVYVARLEARLMRGALASLGKRIDTRLKKLYLKADRQAAELKEASERLEDRRLGELIYQNLYLLKGGDPPATLTDWATGQQVTVPLDRERTPEENAERYFKRYAKAKARLDQLSVERDRVLEDARMLESLRYDLDAAESLSDLGDIEASAVRLGVSPAQSPPPARRRDELKAPPLRTATHSGLPVFIGRNARQNDEVTFQLATPGDLWLHVKDLPGSHVLLRTGEGAVDPEDVEDAALLAAYFSKGRHSSNVPVDVTERRHVRKPRGAVPGYVHYDHHRTLFVTPAKQRLAALLPSDQE